MLSSRQHKQKVCAICGKQESNNWGRHWQFKHPAEYPRQLVPGDEPESPYNPLWIELVEDEDFLKKHQESLQLKEKSKGEIESWLDRNLKHTTDLYFDLDSSDDEDVNEEEEALPKVPLNSQEAAQLDLEKLHT